MAHKHDKPCQVEISSGPILGYSIYYGQKTYYKFEGIPYAKPPLGHLRFLPPSPIKPWTEVLDCTKSPPPPLSYNEHLKIVGSEDCLYIEVTTPNITPDKPLPVMFWIGSYGYVYYMDSVLDPIFLVEKEIIYVRCGFRLGPFGFLSVNEFTAPGNNGLKDIVMALKWVQRNIKFLGGDPNNVTIFGNSSGGAIVHLMMLSPMAAGLFHKAIIQSVSALNNWAFDKNPSVATTELAKELKITKTVRHEIIEELRSISALDIMEALIRLEDASLTNIHTVFESYFKPCIEEEFEGQPAFITKSPALILKSKNFNKVPIIIGSNNIEASCLEFCKSDYYDYEKFNEDCSLLVPRALSLDKKSSKEIGSKLLKFYLDGEEFWREDTKTQYLQLLSDYYFLYYVNKTIRLHCEFAPKCPIFYYINNFAGGWTVCKGLQFLNSVGHFAEIPFIFAIKDADGSHCRGNPDSVTTRKRIVLLWTNFAKYGNPTPCEDDPLLQIKWDPIESQGKLNYLCIGSELTKGRNPFQKRMAFWDELHDSYQALRVLVYFNEIGVCW